MLHSKSQFVRENLVIYVGVLKDCIDFKKKFYSYGIESKLVIKSTQKLTENLKKRLRCFEKGQNF